MAKPRWTQRRSRRAKNKGKQTIEQTSLSVVHPNAAGIDVGNEEHYVAVPPDRDEHPIQSFECFTADLQAMAAWLKRCGIETVAMQSTGVYWLPLYEILEQNGIEVYLVNARHTKNLPGRKTDVQECQWLMKLHTYGLLSNSFQPPEKIRTLRTYWRQRGVHVVEAGTCIQRIQKALTQMNVQIANAISDLSGVTGMRILNAIVAGERDAQKLAVLRDPRIKASQETIVKSLEGNWRQDLLFVVKQEMESWQKRQQQIAECDQKLQEQLAALETKEPVGNPALAPPTASEKMSPAVGRKKAKKKPKGNAPAFDLASQLTRVAGVDLTRIDGIDVMTAQTVMAEVGTDMTMWATEAHFASWLGLSPNNQTSGGKVLSRTTNKVVNRAAKAFRLAASTLLKSQSYLGSQYRRLRARLGAPKAITAMAHKLARLTYRMLKYGSEYVDKGMEYYEQKYRQQELLRLQKKAHELGMQLVQAPAAT
jgi:transposase